MTANEQGTTMAGFQALRYQTAGNDAANIRHVADDVINNGHLFVNDGADINAIKHSKMFVGAYSEKPA